MSHLGGWLTLDVRSHTPEMWSVVKERWGVKSVLDVGCGSGACVEWWKNNGAVAVGIDGDPALMPFWDERGVNCLLHDYRDGPSRIDALGVDKFDLVLSTEFVEHVDEPYVRNFLPDLTRGERLLMTHALPGQGGFHHVNLQEDAYWVELVESAGMVYDKDTTEELRVLCMGKWFWMSGLVFHAKQS